ncbi:putative reverse transcriptase domain-containing protein [Tanacetum coccineum]
MVRAGHAAYIDQFHELVRLVPYLVTPENKMIERYIYGLAPQIRAMVAAMEPTTIQSVVQKAEMLTDEAIKNGALKKITENKGNNGEPSSDGKARDDNKRQISAINSVFRGYKDVCLSTHQRPKTGRVFATITNPVRKEYTGTAPKCLNYSFHHNPRYLVVYRQYAMTLFDSGAGYIIVSTTFIPLLDIKPSDLGFSYKIEIASGQLVEINKVIRDCILEIEGHTFGVDLIPFGHGSFDAIVGMDWLIQNKVEIIFYEKVVRIPLTHSKILRVLGEKPKEKVRYFMSAKTEEQKLRDIVIVRNFLETKEEHEMHLGLILELLKKEKLSGDVAHQGPPIAVINVTPRVVLLPLNSSLHSPGFAKIFPTLGGIECGKT